jgi:hypothetical protein
MVLYKPTNKGIAALALMGTAAFGLTKLMGASTGVSAAVGISAATVVYLILNKA